MKRNSRNDQLILFLYEFQNVIAVGVTSSRSAAGHMMHSIQRVLSYDTTYLSNIAADHMMHSIQRVFSYDTTHLS